ncbi:hypothetical protein [Rufibacter roseus]|uniref:Lipoprotein n=1 Tax=Rufibacter roseus TaxID=1567108 RepID=A0ABW2DG69_9BACT|nr:hypothetical protein [Rufibacter roseus]
MKKLMPFFAASALFLGAACNTYTSTTDPDDHGSGWGLTGDQKATGHTSSRPVAEANNNATFENASTVAGRDTTVNTPQPEADNKTKTKGSQTPQGVEE